MATNTIIRLVDDITGEEAAETVRFGLDGKSYLIDLSDTSAKELRDALAGYIESARAERTPAPARQLRAVVDREQLQAIRVWARTHGWPDVKDRGRVAADVLAAYHAA